MRPHQLRHYTDLPVGALSSHCIFSVRNDVGSVVLDDVVVILSIWGKYLGGTRHWVSKILNRYSVLSGKRTMQMLRKCRTSGWLCLLILHKSLPNDVAAPCPRDSWGGWLLVPSKSGLFRIGITNELILSVLIKILNSLIKT